jgi:hypothetical protein
MASPEQQKLNAIPSSTSADLRAELVAVESQLEAADANENQIERFFKRDELLELSDCLTAEVALATPP